MKKYYKVKPSKMLLQLTDTLLDRLNIQLTEQLFFLTKTWPFFHRPIRCQEKDEMVKSVDSFRETDGTVVMLAVFYVTSPSKQDGA